MRMWCATLLVVAALACCQADGDDFPMPPDALFTDVQRDCGAKGDGVTDDTAALKRAIASERGSSGHTRAVYMPAGTYLVSDTLQWSDKRKVLIGQSRQRTIIRLKDNCEGFGDPAKPKRVLSTEFGHGGQNFLNSIQNLTIDIGAGNPGAVGLAFHTNNGGMLRNITIRSSDPQRTGVIGLDMTYAWFGPGLVRDVSIEGFDRGVLITHDQYSATFANLTLTGQRICGLENRGNTVSIHRLTSENRVPAILNTGGTALLTLVDAKLGGGSSESPAIVNRGDAGLFARDVRVEGYRSAIAGDAATEVGSPLVEEYHSHAPLSCFESRPRSLRLPIELPPEVPYGPIEDWANVESFGAVGDGKTDSTAAFQKAIDSGKPSIYVPSRSGYLITDTLRIRGKLQRLIGLKCGLDFSVGDKPAFRIEDGEADAVVLENVTPTPYRAKYGIYIEQATRRTLVCEGVYSYRNTVPGCRVFMESGCEQPITLDRAKAWIRDLNTESYDVNPHVINRGGELWILGHKTEKDRTIIGTYEGGRTELLGGLLYKNNERVGQAPAFIVDNASASLVYRVKGRPYDIHVQVKRGDETRDLKSSATHTWRALPFTERPD